MEALNYYDDRIRQMQDILDGEHVPEEDRIEIERRKAVLVSTAQKLIMNRPWVDVQLITVPQMTHMKKKMTTGKITMKCMVMTTNFLPWKWVVVFKYLVVMASPPLL